MPTPKQHENSAARQKAYRLRREACRIADLSAKNIPAHAPIPTIPSQARWQALIQLAFETLQTVQKEMENYRDDRSEEWQESEKADLFQERIDRVEEAQGTVQAIG
jgi:hypothetical protein